MRGSSGADALVKATLSVSDASIRAEYVANTARTWRLEDLAESLDELCRRAEQAETDARETLVAVVDALNREELQEIVQKLREQAAGESLLALERLIRHPAQPARNASPSDLRDVKDVRSRVGLLQDARGRTLTLGERKWLARRPDRETLQRLLADPHPDVIRRCLRNPRLTEEDLIPIAARRPGHAEVLAEIARSRWVHRPRVRMALVLNPSTPLEIAIRIAGLLLRHELSLVVHTPGTPAGVRAVCLEHLERRPPMAWKGEHGVH